MWLRTLAVTALLTTTGILGSAMSAQAAEAGKPREAALGWATRHAGASYAWGGTGPSYDCSGLVYSAYRRLGFHVPRTTSQMLASRKLRRVHRPRMGDLAFYGSGHVELYDGRHTTFGALESGKPVWWHEWHRSWGWFPTEYLRVRGAGIG